MNLHRTLALVVLLCCFAAPASAQEWLLDDSLRALAEREKAALVKGVSSAPEKALRALLDEEVNHIERLTEPELETFADEAWARLLAGREDGHLWRAIGAELRAGGALTRELLVKVWNEERARLHTFPERAVYGVVDRVVKATLIDRLTALKDARLNVFRADGAVGDARPGAFPLDQPVVRSSWAERRGDDTTSVRSALPLPKIEFFTKDASIEEALYERTFNTEVGDLKVTAAKVEGLARAVAGRVTYKDAFGSEVEGLGATFTARARLTGLRGDFRSKDLAAATRELSVTAHLNALATLATNAEATHTTLVTERGLGSHSEVRAGAGVEARANLPITIDLKVLTVRVTPYVSAHAGASAEAHATFEVEWTGKLRLDLGAHLSTGIGAGAGVMVEIELGPALKRALERVIARLARVVRPIGDALMGRSWKGPPVDSGKLTLTLEDLERRWAETGAPEVPTLDAATAEGLAVAERYAPVIHQQVERGAWDLMRRVDYDGDWNTLNNWDNLTEQSDRSASVYYDVRETETHYFVTYAIYHPGRHSSAIKPLRNLRRHENDMGGVVIVARKNAAPGREVEVVIAADGAGMKTYSALERQDGERTRWPTNNGFWSGPAQFVNEVDHPRLDLERVHAQVWVEGKTHTVYGFTGRNDGDPFEGEDGVTYVYTGRAEQPESYRDPHCGYDLRPMSELLNQVRNPDVFTTDEPVPARGARYALPKRFRGDEGPNDTAVPPWAWGYWTQDADHNKDDDSFRRTSETIEEGDLFADPARVMNVLFRTPADFSTTYVRNRYLHPSLGRVLPASESAPSTTGATGLAGSVSGSTR